MSLKTIIIHENKNLFNILNEIYSDKFRIILFNKKKFDEEILENFKDYLIVSNKNNLGLNNVLVIKNFPLNIKKIIELININFLKNSFKNQSEIKIGLYLLDLNSKEIRKKDKKISLTEREANLILFLMKADTPVSINTLQKEVWGHASELDTHTVETHIYRLRKKIKTKFEDENFIISSQNGYKIN